MPSLFERQTIIKASVNDDFYYVNLYRMHPSVRHDLLFAYENYPGMFTLYCTLIKVMSKYKGELGGICPLPTHPKASADGINNLILPPACIFGNPYCQPVIKLSS